MLQAQKSQLKKNHDSQDKRSYSNEQSEWHKQGEQNMDYFYSLKEQNNNRTITSVTPQNVTQLTIAYKNTGFGIQDDDVPICRVFSEKSA